MRSDLPSFTRRRLVFALALAPVVGVAGEVGAPRLTARHAFVGNYEQTLLALDAETPVQIASITKLITAWVILSAGLPLDERVRISEEDMVASEFTRSNLALGSSWRRDQLLEWLLVTSDNRAAAALARSYPGGWPEFRYDMRMLMTQMQLFSFDFGDSSGLSTINRACARDLGVLLVTLAQLPEFRRLTHLLTVGGRPNINRFAHDRSVAMLTGKTGFTSAAGYCLAMAEQFGSEVMAMVVLKAAGKDARAQDMNKLRQYARERLVS
ncbi:D-alanyl-D-alanine carboxypeptidase family protein [Azonexus sp. IMCC34839]|uniref:D-alanyl-D-alanine carboxypeptidase family protein n=1 Tax=Azonexus sp. IMCC34839 TaxID=3133695 RepID=UPI00399971BF